MNKVSFKLARTEDRGVHKARPCFTIIYLTDVTINWLARRRWEDNTKMDLQEVV